MGEGKGLRALLIPLFTRPHSLIMSTLRPERDWYWARARTGSCTPAATGTPGYASPSRRSRNGTAGVLLRACGWGQGLRGEGGKPSGWDQN